MLGQDELASRSVQIGSAGFVETASITSPSLADTSHKETARVARLSYQAVRAVQYGDAGAPYWDHPAILNGREDGPEKVPNEATRAALQE